MKHCSNCGKEYADSNTVCLKDATILSEGAYKPWNKPLATAGLVSEQKGLVVNSVGISSRYKPYLILFGAMALLTLVSIAYPFIKAKIYQAASISTFNSSYASTSARDGVMSTLNGWAASTNARDFNTHINYYADMLEVYYARKGVSKNFVSSNRIPAFNKYSSLNVRLSNIEVTLNSSGTSATITYDKTWDFKGVKNSSGSTRQMLWLSNINGRWLITGEKDLQLHYANW